MTALALLGPTVIHMTVYSAGASVGETRFERLADGTFHAAARYKTTDLSIDGREEDGVLASYRAVLGKGPRRKVYDYRDRRLTVREGSKGQDFDFQLPPNVASRFVPALNARLLAGLNGTGPWRPSAWIMDQNDDAAIDIVAAPTRRLGGRRVRSFRMTLADWESEIDLDETGEVVGMEIPSERLRFVADGWNGLFDTPSFSGPSLSEPIHAVQRARNLRLRMRDGRVLLADVARPAGRGRFPVVLLRTSAGRAQALASGDFWASRGYAFVVADRRPGADASDAADTVSELHRQPWADGRVGLVGSGDDALAVWEAAASGVPGVRALAPQATTWRTADAFALAARTTSPVLCLGSPEDPQATRPWEALRRQGRRDGWLVFGPLRTEAVDDLRLRFFDTYLKGLEGGMDAVPRAQVYVENADRWLSLDGWPASTSTFETLYFAKESLVASPAAADASAFFSKSVGPSHSAPAFRLPPEGTYALYRAAPFPKPTALGGPFECRLFLKTAVRDPRLSVSLLDVAPSGAFRPIGLPGESSIEGKSWGPGRIVTALVRPGDAAYELAAQHRLAVLVTASPAFGALKANRNVILSGLVTPSRITFRKLY